ncbi:putative sterol O-acyltransferase 1 [Apostichopus japonicus]|uniref:Putative sterol O-acyltransferase 1 n=1 Tax=Stichopus japonicus TaxID=307972 RepID=A0A2G8LQK5_STIJA|nr:putative sterol O-acyltransferase 1 [Apostichopus japonicus]
MNGSLFSEQLFHGVDPSLLSGTNPQSHEILMEQVKEAAEQAKGTFVAHMENQLKNMKVSDNRLVRPGVEELDSNENKKSLRVSGNKFLPRQSMLTDLLQNKNIRTLNNIFVAVLFVIILNSALMHLLNFRNVGVTFELAFWTIGKVPLVLYIWCQMMLWATAAFFSTLSIWAHHPSSTVGPWKIPNVAWLVLYIAGVLAFLIYPPVFVIYHDLPVLSSSIVLMEQVRLIMKMHAFLRVVIPRASAWKHKVNDEINGIDREWEVNTPPKNMDEDAPCPDFSCYLYFLFAPTLIYQDKYPMSSRIRWNIVRQNVVQCFVTGCYVFLICEKMIMPVTVTFAEDTYTFGDFIKAVCTCMIPACACLFLSFYTVLHCWLNAAGEMVRFADRQFYKV